MQHNAATTARKFGSGVLVSLVGMHGLLTSISLAHDGLGFGSDGSDSLLLSEGGEELPVTTTQREISLCYYQHYHPHISEFVVDLYSGRGVVERPGVLQLPRQETNAVSFEASPVISVGRREVFEIYRAYYLFHATFLSPPRCIGFCQQQQQQQQQLSEFPSNANQQQQEDYPSVVKLEFTYLLHQCYFGLVQDKSLLVVHATLPLEPPETEPRGNLDKRTMVVLPPPPSPLEIVKLEERWNGVPSLDHAWIRMSRRINGLLSWYFTTLLVPDRPIPRSKT